MPERKPRTITIELPLPPKMTHPNARPPHWAVKSKATAKQRRDAFFAATAAVAGKRFEPMKSAIIQSHWKTARQNDPDNFIAWLKATIDGIAGAKLIGNDKNLTHLPPTQEQFPKKADAHKRGVILVITEKL